MKVRMKVAMHGPGVDRPIGAEVEVGDDEAQRLIERDFAEAIEDDSNGDTENADDPAPADAETTEDPAPKSATKATSRKRARAERR